jgi:hypothetical protein
LCYCCWQNADRLDSEIIYDRDFDYDYFGFKVRVTGVISLLSHALVLCPALLDWLVCLQHRLAARKARSASGSR